MALFRVSNAVCCVLMAVFRMLMAVFRILIAVCRFFIAVCRIYDTAQVSDWLSIATNGAVPTGPSLYAYAHLLSFLSKADHAAPAFWCVKFCAHTCFHDCLLTPLRSG